MPAAKKFPVLGVAELCYMLDLSRPRVSQIVDQDDFPKGIELRMGRVWWAEEIEAYFAATGRNLRRLPASWPVAPADAEKGTPATAARYRK